MDLVTHAADHPARVAGGDDRRLVGGADQAWAQAHGERLVLLLKAPFRQARIGAGVDDLLGGQILRALRYAMALQVVRTGADHPANAADLQGE